MLVACRLAGLSALEAHYADDNAQAQSGVKESLYPSRCTERPRGANSAPETTVDGLDGSSGGIWPAKAGNAASGQIWGSWSDAGAAGEQPPIRAPSPSMFSGKA